MLKNLMQLKYLRTEYEVWLLNNKTFTVNPVQITYSFDIISSLCLMHSSFLTFFWLKHY